MVDSGHYHEANSTRLVLLIAVAKSFSNGCNVAHISIHRDAVAYGSDCAVSHCQCQLSYSTLFDLIAGGLL